MNKKGVNIILMIGEILVVSIIIFGTIKIAHSYGSSLLSSQINTAEDMRMMIDTLVGVPGDAEVIYPYNVSEFTFDLGKSGITVIRGEDKRDWVTRAFFLPEGYTAIGFVENPSNICLKKKLKKITMFDCVK